MLTIANDLSQRQAPFEVYETIKAKGIQINVLVNNAGQRLFGLFVDTDINRKLDYRHGFISQNPYGRI